MKIMKLNRPWMELKSMLISAIQKFSFRNATGSPPAISTMVIVVLQIIMFRKLNAYRKH